MRADNGWRKTPTRYRVTELAHLHRVQASSRVDPLVCAFSNNSVCGQNAREIAARQSRVTASSLIIHANVAANISLRSRVRCRYRRKSCWIDRARIGLSLSLSLSSLSFSLSLSTYGQNALSTMKYRNLGCNARGKFARTTDRQPLIYSRTTVAAVKAASRNYTTTRGCHAADTMDLITSDGKKIAWIGFVFR